MAMMMVMVAIAD